VHNTTQTAQSHRTDCPASGPLIARSLRPYGAPPPLTEELGGSHRGSVRSGVSTRIWLSRPAALERGAVVVEVGVSDCHGTTTGDLGKYLIEELARRALCTSVAARHTDRDGLANRETQRYDASGLQTDVGCLGG